jgi:iron complex outermembrane recepter protein
VVADESAYVTFELEPSPLVIPGLVITGTLTERSARETLRPVNVMSGDELQRRLQSTVAATLASEPGLATTGMGPATARPVIRGLSGDRVLLLEDGARVGDVSSGSADHATALDPTSALRIEVVRGPAALLYGSNALGGVVNVIRDEVPSWVPHHPTGAATLQTQTVNSTYAGSAFMQLALSGSVPLRVEVTGRTSGDLRTPAGTLDNTGADSWTAGAGTAYVSDWGHVGGAFRYYRNDYGIPGGFVGGHPEGVRVEMERTSSKLRGLVDRRVGPFESLELDATYTWYRHSEIEPPDILGTFFKLRTLSGDVLARHGALGPFSSGAIGARTSWEDFVFRGDLSTPDSRRYTAAAYAFEEIDLEPVTVEAGLRYDWVRVDPLEEDPDSPIGAIRDRTFHAASGSLGLLLDAGAGVTLGASVARAFRTPDIGELYSEGPHLAAYAYEVGNPSLGTEVGTGVDAFVRFGTDAVEAEVTAFYNDIAGYVYGEETGEISPVQLPVYQFKGSDAVLEGFEGRVDWRTVGDLVVQGTASYVRGSLRETDEPLPLIPPLHGRVALEYAPTRWFARAEAELAKGQSRIGEFETATDGYRVFHAAAGLRVTLGGRLHVLTLSLENLTDEEYRNHLSRVKEIMPEAGRGLSVTYRVVF